MPLPPTIAWSNDGTAVRIIDQRQLPASEVILELTTVADVCDAIANLAVRGAPAIGIAGAMGLVVAARSIDASSREGFLAALRDAAMLLRRTRPTAVNLPWALDRMLASAAATQGEPADISERLREEADRIAEEDRTMCRRIGECGASLIRGAARVLTHCNAGALATGGIGTALAPLYVAAERGQHVEVFVDETRPLLQGSRLTAWELSRAGIPVTVLTDGAAASLMRAGRIDLCIVGADRIAANGDVANKVGTYALAVAARHHGIPFYVAAPASTFDAATATGSDMVIEHRSGEEVTHTFGVVTAPEGVSIHNPAFDITPSALITAIISDTGIHSPPFAF
jgi:methylthioribose-1-phosphate isomerase